MSRPPHTPPPDYAGIRIGMVILPIDLPAVPGECSCDVAVGSMKACGRVICIECGKVMSPRVVARASG